MVKRYAELYQRRRRYRNTDKKPYDNKIGL
nr:MAG TPA: hypothetical protein [Caudoviricetes sp.]